jgi:hypothetical protein
MPLRALDGGSEVGVTGLNPDQGVFIARVSMAPAVPGRNSLILLVEFIAISDCLRLERLPGGPCTHWKRRVVTAHAYRGH